MARIAGEVTGVSGSTVTIKAEDGTAEQVVTTENTRLMKDRGPVTVADLHAGDGLMAFGNLDAPNHTLRAAVVMATDAAQVKAMRENLGKTYITGRVTAVDLDHAKMTVERGGRVAQTIGFDETTSFKRAVRGGGGGSGSPNAGGEGGGRFGGWIDGVSTANLDRAFAEGESITLADVKVGDVVIGTGAVKHGVFVPTRLMDRPPGQHRSRDGAQPPMATPTTNALPDHPGHSGPGA